MRDTKPFIQTQNARRENYALALGLPEQAVAVQQIAAIVPTGRAERNAKAFPNTMQSLLFGQQF